MNFLEILIPLCHILGLKHAPNMMKKMYVPFRMSSKLVAQDSHSVYRSTTMEMLFQFLCSC